MASHLYSILLPYLIGLALIGYVFVLGRLQQLVASKPGFWLALTIHVVFGGLSLIYLPPSIYRTFLTGALSEVQKVIAGVALLILVFLALWLVNQFNRSLGTITAITKNQSNGREETGESPK